MCISAVWPVGATSLGFFSAKSLVYTYMYVVQNSMHVHIKVAFSMIHDVRNNRHVLIAALDVSSSKGCMH